MNRLETREAFAAALSVALAEAGADPPLVRLVAERFADFPSFEYSFQGVSGAPEELAEETLSEDGGDLHALVQDIFREVLLDADRWGDGTPVVPADPAGRLALAAAAAARFVSNFRAALRAKMD